MIKDWKRADPEEDFFYAEVKFFDRRTNNQKIFKSDRSRSFGTLPGPILREYWTSKGAILLVDFSYWLANYLNCVINTIIYKSFRRKASANSI